MRTPTLAERGEPVGAAADPEAERTVPPAGWLALSACGTFMVAFYVITARALGPDQLHDDLGIQYYLARITGEGAIPLIDFEHGWNTASWYLSAVFYRLADGNPTGWLFLWGRSGLLLGSLCVLVIAWRRRLSAGWLAGLVTTWMLLTTISHNKYATATVWVTILLPVWGQRTSTARALRVGMAATVFWFHVELAVLLAIGTAMYDLLGTREGNWRTRFVTALHAPVGVVVGLASQVAVYRALGLGAGEFLSQAIGDWTITDFGPLFGYPITAPANIYIAIFPLVLLLPFTPLVWRRLSGDTRLLAMCNLALSLIAIRRTDPLHVASAGTLMMLIVVLGVRDLHPDRARLNAHLDTVCRGLTRPATIGLLVAGAGWYLLGIAAAFRVESLAAIVAVTVVALAGVVTSWRHEVPTAGIGAATIAILLLVGSVVNGLFIAVDADDAFGQTVAIADTIRADVDACTSPTREAWVVPSPLTLYDALAITNPTRIYAFHYNLQAQAGELRESIERGEIPAIIQVGPWPPSMTPLVGDIEQHYVQCGNHVAGGRQVTVWEYNGVD